jgi:hypothetical protein
MRRILWGLLAWVLLVAGAPFVNPNFEVWRNGDGYSAVHEWPSPNNRSGRHDRDAWREDHLSLPEVYQRAAHAGLNDLWRLVVPSAQALTPQQQLLLSGGFRWVLQGASLDYDFDFAGNRYFQNGSIALSNAVTVVRASNCMIDDLAGNWTTFPANTLCRSNKGMTSWESRTNGVRNGAATGGSAPSTPPTNWAIPTIAGIVPTLAYATVQGVDGVIVTYNGTPNASSAGAIALETATQIAATYGQTWSNSVFSNLYAGAATNATFSLRYQTVTSGGVGIVQSQILAYTPTSTLQRVVGSATTMDPTTAAVQPFIRLFFTLNQPVAFSLFLGLPQLENNNIPASVASATVAAGGTVTGVTRTMGVMGGVSGGIAQGPATVVGTTVTAFAVTNGVSYTVLPPSPAPLADTIFSGSISGTTLTVPTVYIGAVASGMVLIDLAGGVSAGTVILSGSGTTWVINNSQTVGSRVLGGTAGTAAPTVTITPTDNSAQGFATSPIRTTNAAATRAADVVTVTRPPVFTTRNSFFAKGTTFANSGNPVILQLAPNGPAVFSPPNAVYVNSSGGNTLIAGASWLRGVPGRVMVASAPGDQAAVFNGGAITTSAFTLSAPTAVYIGGQTVGGNWNVYIEEIAGWPTTRVPNATEQAITR